MVKFLKDSIIFFKNFGVFLCREDYITPPPPSRSFLFVRSSLHFNKNALIINLLIVTGHPLILVSLALPGPFKICLQRFHAHE